MVVQWNALLLVWTSLPQMHFLAPVLGKAHGAHLATSKRFRATVVGTRTSTAKPCPCPCTVAKYYQKCSPNTPGAEKTIAHMRPNLMSYERGYAATILSILKDRKSNKSYLQCLSMLKHA